MLLNCFVGFLMNFFQCEGGFFSVPFLVAKTKLNKKSIRKRWDDVFEFWMTFIDFLICIINYQDVIK